MFTSDRISCLVWMSHLSVRLIFQNSSNFVGFSGGPRFLVQYYRSVKLSMWKLLNFSPNIWMVDNVLALTQAFSVFALFYFRAHDLHFLVYHVDDYVD